jgi:LDH2 family malate/lactate/ureidoglycolate dehydrogenase
MIDQIKSCRKRPGAAEILVPGERSARTTKENLERGIKLDAATFKELTDLSAQYGIATKFSAAARCG